MLVEIEMLREIDVPLFDISVTYLQNLCICKSE